MQAVGNRREATVPEREPLSLPLPAAVWKRIIRAVNTKEDVLIGIKFEHGRVAWARAEKEIDLEQ